MGEEGGQIPGISFKTTRQTCYHEGIASQVTVNYYLNRNNTCYVYAIKTVVRNLFLCDRNSCTEMVH